MGKLRRFTVLLPVPDGASGEDRMATLGIQTYEQDGKILIDTVTLAARRPIGAGDGSADPERQGAHRALAKELMWLPGFLLFGAVVWLQRRRVARPDHHY